MYPHAFPLHWIKGNCGIFYTLHYLLRLTKKMVLGGGGGGCDLKWLGKEHIGEGGDFLVGEDTTKDTMLIKQGSFIFRRKVTSQGLINKIFLDGGR